MESMLENASNDNAVHELAEMFGRCVAAGLSGDTNFADRERRALELGNQLVRQHLEAWLQAMADGEAERMQVDGIAYRRHELGRVKYHSLCGPLHVRRWTFRPVGVRNGETRVPLDLRAGLVQGATPQLAFSVAQGYAKAPIRSVEQDFHAAFRVPPSRTTLERMAKEIGSHARAVSIRLESRLRAEESLPDGAVAISLGLDRTTIPMAEGVAPGDPLPPRRRRTPLQRRVPPRRLLRYRMGYVGTVCITNRDGESLVTRRYAAAAHAGPASVLARMMADLRQALRQRPDLNIGVVQDAAPELWNRMRDALRAELKVPGRGWGIHAWRRQPWREVIDWYHLMQHLAAGLELLVEDQSRRRQLLDEWKEKLSRNDGAIRQIAHWFEQTAAARSPEMWSKMHQVVGRYIHVAWRFRYATMKKLGLPTGSGVTEGACKSLIAKRTKRSGQRWRPRGISAVLALRSLLESDRLHRFWTLFAPRYTAVCNAA